MEGNRLQTERNRRAGAERTRFVTANRDALQAADRLDGHAERITGLRRARINANPQRKREIDASLRTLLAEATSLARELGSK
jgi:hypothetical protein